MTTETFTESPEVASNGMPVPGGTEEALGWVVRAHTVEGETLIGVVRATTYTKIGVQWEGCCPRECCLDKITFAQVDEWIGLEKCPCGSGQDLVLCLCEEPEHENPSAPEDDDEE